MKQSVYLTESKLRNIIREALQEILETRACLGASYYAVRHLAHDVKAGDLEAIDRAALLMCKYVPVGSIIIPIPQHSGKAEYTLKLANRIAQLSKAKVRDILSTQPRQSSLYMQKQREVDTSKMNLGFRVFYDKNIAQELKSARNVILIDNAIDSGLTYEQSAQAIKQAYGVDAWLLTLGAVVNPKDKSQDIIRSIYPTYRVHEEAEPSETDSL